MLVFVDESGDTGLNARDGSTRYFVLTLILFETPEAAAKLTQRVERLRLELKLPLSYEFHFFKTKNVLRRAFLEAVRGEDFRFCALVVDKYRLNGPEFLKRDSFYQQICATAFSRAAPWLDAANVQFDESGSRDSRRRLASYLMNVINLPGDSRIKKVGSQDSQGNSLMQLADMLCGTVARKYERGAEDADEFLRIVQARRLWI